MTKDPLISQTRLSLAEYIAEHAAAEGVALEPTLRPDRDLILMDQLYEAEIDGRRVIVSWSDDRDLDSFVRKAGTNFEFDLLQILMRADPTLFDRVWTAIRMWLIDRSDERVVLSKVS